MSTFKTRFAPSPSGFLHIGNVRTALFSALLARQHAGVFLLRIEDTDRERSAPAYTAALVEDLHWLGLVWQEGPYHQSERGDVYARYFAELEHKALAYPCFCTEQELKLERKAQLAAGRPPRYGGRCARLDQDSARHKLAAGMPASLRFRVPTATAIEFDDKVRGPQRFNSEDIGDFIIRRSDGTPAFFFSNAIDDALMGVSLVLRGEDHLTNTPRQILLLQALSLPVPVYGHIALVVGADGAPLSKRHGSRSVRELRDAGYFPIAVDNYLARLGHSYPEHTELMTLEALARHFALARVGQAPARYDDAQLLYWQRQAVLQASEEALWAWMGEAVHALVPAAQRQAFMDAIRTNVTFPEQALFWARIVFTDEWEIGDAAKAVVGASGAVFFDQAARALAHAGTDFQALAAALKAATGAKGKSLFQPLRAALTGELDGPEMARLLPLLGVDRARARLQRAARLPAAHNAD